MRIPRQDTLENLVMEISNKDYTENPDEQIRTELEYEEPTPFNVPRDKVVRILKNNYVEPSKKLQSLYESQFRSFSARGSNSGSDSFDAIL